MPSAARAGERRRLGHDHGEQVVEVVCDAAGEPADRLELLRLAQVRLGLAQRRGALGDAQLELLVDPLERLARPAALGHVLGDAEQVARRPVGVEDRDLLGVEPALAGGGVDRLLVDLHDLARGQRLAVLLLEERGLLGREEVEVALAQHRLARLPEQLLAGAVEPLEPQLGRVLDEDHVRQVLDDRVEEQVGAAERGVGLGVGLGAGRRHHRDRPAGRERPHRRAGEAVDRLAERRGVDRRRVRQRGEGRGRQPRTRGGVDQEQLAHWTGDDHALGERVEHGLHPLVRHHHVPARTLSRRRARAARGQQRSQNSSPIPNHPSISIASSPSGASRPWNVPNGPRYLLRTISALTATSPGTSGVNVTSTRPAASRTIHRSPGWRGRSRVNVTAGSRPTLSPSHAQFSLYVSGSRHWLRVRLNPRATPAASNVALVTQSHFIT
jgi:hypothetical protein